MQDILASNLRRLRIARHLSLSELARATGMGKATLSGIENARSNPTIETLAGLAGALRVPILELLGELPPGEVRIVRSADAAFDPRAGLARRVLDECEPGGGVEVWELALDALESREPAPRAQGTRMSLYVIEGSLIAGPVERSTELGRGDYMSFPADVPYVLAAGRRRACALALTQAPEAS